jgi:hypothetical protein
MMDRLHTDLTTSTNNRPMNWLTPGAMRRFLGVWMCLCSVVNLAGQISPSEAELRTAISAGGVIKFASSGTIALTKPLIVSKDATIDADGNKVTLDGGNTSQLMIVTAGVRLELRGLVFANGLIKGHDVPNKGSPGGPAFGGAISNDWGFLFITNCVFTNNHAIGGGVIPLGASGTALGGAIWQNGGSIFIQNSVFINNRAIAGFGIGGARGGAIHAQRDGDMEIVTTTFEGNEADSDGGAIWSQYALKLSKCAFTSNRAELGGAIAPHSSSTITNCAFIRNKAVAGGAIFLWNWPSILSRCSFVANYAAKGSAIMGILAMSGEIDNSTFFGNRGGCVMASLALTYSGTNLTFANNVSDSALFVNDFGGRYVFKNSLFGTNTTAAPETSVTDAGNNLSATAMPEFNHPSSQNNADVKLGGIGDFGGDTPTMPLLSGSAAIDAGDDLAAPTTDQRGRARPFGNRSDVGAFESSAPFFVVGRVDGYLKEPITARLGNSSTVPDSNGDFRFAHPGGQTTLEFLGANDVLFRPQLLAFDVLADTYVKTRAFKIGALAFDPDLDGPAFTFAGNGGERWKFDLSHDLTRWSPMYTNTFQGTGLFSIPIANIEVPLFIRGSKTE